MKKCLHFREIGDSAGISYVDRDCSFWLLVLKPPL